MFNLCFANLYVKSGDGGNGSNAITISLFNKKIYHGGNGGNGGSIVFKYNDKILINNNIVKNRVYADNGFNGKHGKKNGKNGADIIIPTSQICNIYLDDNFKCQINKLNQFFIIKGGRGGLGSRYTKNIIENNNNIGEKTKIHKVLMQAVLPYGFGHIFRKYNYNTINKIQNIFGYKCSTDQNIICITKNNINNYIFFMDVYESISILKNNISNIEKIIFYDDKINDLYNILDVIRDNKICYSFLTSSMQEIS